jgi:branched-subunit amino acid transport protein
VQAESDALGSVLGSCSIVFAGRYVPFRLSAPVQLSRS